MKVTHEAFDLSPFTSAPLRMEALIEFNGRTPQQVFEVLGDPALIPEWYLLAKEVKIHGPGEDGAERFNVEFTFFGDVYEEVLHWDPPRRYVYLAKGEDFPIKDYVAMIEVAATGPSTGVMRWNVYFDVIEGAHFRRILPVMLPPITADSIRRLAPLIGGTRHEVRSHFEEES